MCGFCARHWFAGVRQLRFLHFVGGEVYLDVDVHVVRTTKM